MMRKSSELTPASIIGLFMAGLLLMPLNANAATQPVSKSREYVIILHGMGRTKYSMLKLETYLSGLGYHVINDGYPSTLETVGKIADVYLAPIVNKCRENGAEKIHIVTHSLGGIVTRQYLQDHFLPRGSRIVMISPPNKGSELADAFRNLSFYKWLNGPAGQVLGTEEGSLPNTLNPVKEEIGVIAGNRSLNPFYSWLIPGEDDGKVSVERAKLSEMKDFLVVASSHSFIMNNDVVLQQVACFLEKGAFDKVLSDY